MALVDAAFLQDPYPTYRALRDTGPVLWSDEFFGGAWLLTRHADVEAVLRDDARFSARRTGGWVSHDGKERKELRGFQQLFARAMLFVDAPDHQRLRRVMNAGFRPAALQALQPWLQARTGALLDAVDPARPFDFMAAVARPLPAAVIAKMMGMPDADHAEFVAWSDDLADFIGAPQPGFEQACSAQRSLLAMARRFEALLQDKRRVPGDDLASRLAQAQADGEIESGAELLAQCTMLLFAGHETTRNALGNGLHALLSQRSAWNALLRDPQRLPNAVRELLRYDSPVQYTGRRVASDLELHGHPLRRGQLVVALIGSANRDAGRHADPDRLDIAREGIGLPLSFGSGPHVCIGAALTQMEVETVLAALLARWPALALVDERPRWCRNAVYRGLESLAVEIPLETSMGTPVAVQ